jgi:AbrB family looped-hinge helix DNA binding protein
MPTAKVTSKGQITVPASIRRALDVETGDFLAFEVKADYVVVRRQDSLKEASARIRESTHGRTPMYGDDDEAVLSAFGEVDQGELGDELFVVRVTPEDLA